MASPSHSSRATPTLPSLSHTAGPSTISSMPPSPASLSAAPGSAAAAVLGDLKGEEGLSHLEPRVKGEGEEEIVEHLAEELKEEGESDPQVRKLETER